MQSVSCKMRIASDKAALPFDKFSVMFMSKN